MDESTRDNDHSGEFCELPIHPLAVTFARKLNRNMPVDWNKVLQSDMPLKIMEDIMAFVPGSAKAALGRSVLQYLAEGSDPRAFMELLGSLCLLHKHRWCNLAVALNLAGERALPEDANQFIECVLAARTYEHERWFVESNVLTIKGTAFVRVSSLKSAADLMHEVFGEKSPRKRPWFQLHLSTCVVLMVVAGIGVWINVKPGGGYFSVLDKGASRQRSVEYTISPQSFPGIEPCDVYKNGNTIVKLSYSEVALLRPWLVACTADFGWPFYYAQNASYSQPEGTLELTEALKSLPPVYPSDMGQWSFKMLALNSTIWLFSLLFFAGSFEFILRRRERARSAKEPAP